MTGKLWVPGGLTGIGREVALKWERDGHGKAIVTGTEVDVRHPGSLRFFFDSENQQHDPITHVAYCAGINGLSWIKDIDNFDFMNMMNVNVVGMVNVLALLAQSEWRGSFTAITSDAAITPMRGSIMYCSSKAAQAQAVRVAARELAPHIRVNAVAPSVVSDTGMSEYMDDEICEFRGWDRDEAQAYERSMVPMGRRAAPEEVAQVVIDTLNGPEFLTGSIVTLTGGK